MRGPLSRKMYLHLKQGPSTVPVKRSEPGDNDTEYFHWLCNVADAPDDEGYTYLLRVLYGIEFFWIHPNDENRAVDITTLIERYVEETGEYPEKDNSVSVFEVLLALAGRINFQMDGGFSKYFWELLENLEVLRFTSDPRLRTPSGAKRVEEEIRKIVFTWLYRQHLSDGVGGIFPLERPQMDQRELEIWVQMSQYLHEKYLGRW